jgi:hypothetical protein
VSANQQDEFSWLFKGEAGSEVKDRPSEARRTNRFLQSGKERKERSKARPRSKTIPDGEWARLLSGADSRIDSGEWSDASAKDLVALSAIMHSDVYGIESADLTPEMRLVASFQAGRLLEKDFSGDAGAFADFVRWTWQREVGRIEWRKKNNQASTFRLTWRLQFGPAILTDYRVWKLQQEGRR